MGLDLTHLWVALDIGVEPKIGVEISTPKSSHFNRVFMGLEPL